LLQTKAIRRLTDQIRESENKERVLLFLIIIGIWLFLRVISSSLPDNIEKLITTPLSILGLFLFSVLILIYTLVTSTLEIFFSRKTKISHSQSQASEKFSLNKPFFDVLIPCHNEESVIEKTLKNIIQIDYKNYSVYLIDDRSTDKTCELIEKFIKKNKLEQKISLIKRKTDSKPGKAAALNECFRHSCQGELIIVFDADARVRPDCLNKSLKYFENKKNIALQFQKKISNANFNRLTKYQDLQHVIDTKLQVGRDLINGFVELRGNGQIIRRSCLEKIGGWDEDTLTDDLEISTRIHALGWDIRFAPEIEVLEEGVIKTRALIQQTRRWVEGSLRRYLTHFNLFFVTSLKQLGLTKRLDVVPFLGEFIVPLWFLLDFVGQTFSLVFTKERTHFLLLFSVIFVLNLMFWLNSLLGLLRYRQELKPIENLGRSFLSVYSCLHWSLIVLLSIRKILFGRRPSIWRKTPRMSDKY